MFPSAYFAAQYFAPRYFPEAGAAGPVFHPSWADGCNIVLTRGQP